MEQKKCNIYAQTDIQQNTMYKNVYPCILDYAKVVDNVHHGTVITAMQLWQNLYWKIQTDLGKYTRGGEEDNGSYYWNYFTYTVKQSINHQLKHDASWLAKESLTNWQHQNHTTTTN